MDAEEEVGRRILGIEIKLLECLTALHPELSPDERMQLLQDETLAFWVQVGEDIRQAMYEAAFRYGGGELFDDIQRVDDPDKALPPAVTMRLLSSRAGKRAVEEVLRDAEQAAKRRQRSQRRDARRRSHRRWWFL
jgi:hypothetical protein